MNTKLFSVAAIMAAGAMACEDNVKCTLYTEDNYGGDAHSFCLGNYFGSDTPVHTSGHSFVYNHQHIFAMDTLSSFKCGADV